jgi:hypothetical protein
MKENIKKIQEGNSRHRKKCSASRRMEKNGEGFDTE